MAGHSKWATTKHRKAAADAKRGKLFARLVKNIEVAARTGGGDPDANPTLYDAIQTARRNSVPSDNIERAVKRGSGAEEGGADWETIMYEGYAPGGVAVLIECLTDNRNRAAADVRTALTRHGGNLAQPGSVSYLFERVGTVEVPAKGTTEDDVFEAAIEGGAEEILDFMDKFFVYSAPQDVVDVRTALQQAGIEYDSAEVGFKAATEITLDLPAAKKVLKLLEALDDVDDVQDVYTNMTVSETDMAALEKED